jgi:hypothetical protein
MSYALPISIRPFRDADRKYVVSTSVAGMSAYSKCRRNFPFIRAACWSLVDNLLDNCKTIVACHPEYNDQIFGYLIHSDGTIFWIFTKKDFRCEQVAHRLLMSAGMKRPINCCFKTPAAEGLKNKWGLTFDASPLLKVKK